MGNEFEKMQDKYASVLQSEGVGALNDEEAALEKQVQIEEEHIATMVEGARADVTSTDADAPSSWREDLLRWIEVAGVAEAPHLYEEGGMASEYAGNVMPKLWLASEDDRREMFNGYWKLVRNCRDRIRSLKKRLQAVQGARKSWINRGAVSPSCSHVVINGHHAPKYAHEARDVLSEREWVSSFSKLAVYMEEPTVNGSSKVDTLKRQTGYDELPSEEKRFEQFKELLFAAEIT